MTTSNADLHWIASYIWGIADDVLRDLYVRESSEAWASTGTRVPLYALLENLASGATIDEFVEWFPSVDEQQVRAVLEHEAKASRKALAR